MEIYIERCKLFDIKPQILSEDLPEVVREICYKIMAQIPTAKFNVSGNECIFSIEIDINCQWKARINSDFGRDEHKAIVEIIEPYGYFISSESDVDCGIKYVIKKKDLTEEEKVDGILDLVNKIGKILDDIKIPTEVEKPKLNLDDYVHLIYHAPCVIKEIGDDCVELPANKANLEYYGITTEMVESLVGFSEDLWGYVESYFMNNIVHISQSAVINDEGELVIQFDVYIKFATPELGEYIKEFLSGQCSDGWGEGLEQQKVTSIDGKDIYISPWSYENWELSRI